VSYLYKNPNIWFNATNEDDKKIVLNYEKEFKETLYSYPKLISNSPLEYINYIITLDQLPYYIYRNNYNHDNFILSHKKSIDLLIEIFFKTNIPNINEFILNYDNLKNKDNYYIFPNKILWSLMLNKDSSVAFYKVFLLLPLRHTKCQLFVNMAFNISKLLIKLNPELSVYKRFYKASLLQLELLDNKNQIKLCTQKLSRYIFNNYNENILEMLDIVNSKYLKWSSTEFNTFFKTIKTIDIKNLNLDIISNFNNVIKDINLECDNKELVLSISGGVDSMVLYLLLKSYGYKVHTVFINYNNRNNSNIELEFVKYYLDSLSSEEEYNFYKTIKTIKRNMDTLHLRDVYEDSTRKIRFDMYKQVLLSNKVNAKYIVLGHNKDDCLENIFTNITKCQKYDNLLGMSILSEEMGVRIMRPMLGIMKSSIYELARYIGMPFLEDSTPKWSMRGRMRDILIPNIMKFDSRIIDGLYALSGYVSNSEKYLEKYINSLIEYKIPKEEFVKHKLNLDKILVCKINEKIKKDSSIEELSMMLKKILGDICMELKLPYVSKKSINNMSRVLLCSVLDKQKTYTINNKFIFNYLDGFIIVNFSGS
jgi:tRNA(Ile)-lysidine synthetase-like protein